MTAERVCGPTEAGPPLRTDAANGRQVAYAEYGDQSGDPVLFLHGTPGSRLLGGVLDEAARIRGVRVLAPDRPGYGQSTPWPERRPTDAGRYLVPVLDDAGVDAARVVAFSGGAPFALALAASRPRRVSSVDLVSGATPPSVGPGPPTGLRAVGAVADRLPRLLAGVYRTQGWLAERGPPELAVAPYTDSDGRASVPDDVAALVARDAAEAVRESPQGAVHESRLFADEWGVDLSAVDQRVRVWHGRRDGNAPVAGARELAARLPAAEPTVVDGDHLTTLLSVADRLLADRDGGRPAP